MCMKDSSEHKTMIKLIHMKVLCKPLRFTAMILLILKTESMKLAQNENWLMKTTEAM